MPRVPRHPGTGKAPVNTPARGLGWGGQPTGKPASGAPANNGVGIPPPPLQKRCPDGTFAVTDRGIVRRAAADASFAMLVAHRDRILAQIEEGDATPMHEMMLRDVCAQIIRIVDPPPKQSIEVDGSGLVIQVVNYADPPAT